MLILTRKVGQSFTVGDNVEIVITEISGDKVRVGINAPKEIKVLRAELTQTMEQNQQAASGPDSTVLRALAANLKKGTAAAAQDATGKAPEADSLQD